MIERSRRVVLLIDYDNLQICASRDTPGRELQLPPVVQLAQRYGTVILARAYAEWNLSTERLAVYKAGIEPAFAPVLRTESDRSGKSLADTVMVAEGMDMLWTLSPEVVVLATSDKDLIPLVRVAKQRGAFVVVLGSDFTAIPLREMADEHVTYRQLITDGTGRFTADLTAARQAAALAEPARRRARDRTVRERPAIAAPGSPPVSARPEMRPEREAVAASPAVSPVSSSTPSQSEPVAPVASGLSGDADSQIGGRRRRRRGSRRRSDRLGTPGEGATSPETVSALDAYGSDEPSSEPEDEDRDQDVEITPTVSTAEVALASSGTVEEPFEAPSEPEIEVVAAAEPVVATPLRTRRRRARVVAPASIAEAAPSDEAPAIADMLAGGEPTLEHGLTPSTENGVSVTADNGATPSADNGVTPSADNGVSSSGEEALPTPPRTTRPRRVASASRGRRTR